MSSQIASYLSKVAQSLASGHATEHSYRPELRDLFETLTKYHVINEPKRSEHGAPDFVFIKGESVPVGYAEAKDIHINLEKIVKSEQLARYFGYARLILTNGIEFRFFKNGSVYGEPIVLATKNGNTLIVHEDKFQSFTDTLTELLAGNLDDIRSAKNLAQIMGGKARRIRDDLRVMLTEANRSAGKYADIFALYDIFKKEILHDLDYHNFADLYAQTLVYGLFVARYNDATPENFTRSEARDLVPKSNPLLRKFFDHIAGEGFEKRLGYIVDELCDVFAHADVRALMHGLYQKADIETHDPVIHFYEDFLGEYDASMRKQRGVFYTPAPVVRFIVRAVDNILKTHFGLKRGLADTSKIKHETMGHVTDKRGKMSTKSVTEEVHRVQILDPATGTGTFLNEVIRHIHGSMKDQTGIWPSYVQNDLIPRLHGFELMMASYTIAHLKLGLTLAETGVSELDQRLQVYLTNSLEEAKTSRETQGTFFGLGDAITKEGQYADEVKADKPIMVILGNPPYSGHSGNKGLFEKELNAYKQEPGGGKLQERNSKWLNDDYVKFFRLAESMIEKNNEGIMAFITNRSYLDNPTFRGMRYKLMQSFDSIYLIDLHGDANKLEKDVDGGTDENVFDIKQGTAIFIGVKIQKPSSDLGKIYKYDLYGKRDYKYNWLEKTVISDISNEINTQGPFHVFTQQNKALLTSYNNYFSIADIFIKYSIGIYTGHDEDVVSMSETDLKNRYENSQKITKYSYRAFDDRFLLDENEEIARGRYNFYASFTPECVCLVTGRQFPVDMPWNLAYMMKGKLDLNLMRGGASQFPLYLYSDAENLENQTRTPNLDETIWSAIDAIVATPLNPPLSGGQKSTTPEQILDYIYAVLHSPSYREKYREFLKIDFPRVPYPRDRESFLALVALGGELRALHLLESPKVEDFMTSYPVAGDNVVEAVKYVNEKVFINATQYFGGVPESVWNHPIGGYMPAQKWLKDRKSRTLTNDDIMHYQRMIVALAETARVMEEVDRVIKI